MSSIVSIETLQASMRNLQQQIGSLRIDMEAKANAKQVEQYRINLINLQADVTKKAASKDISLLDQRLQLMEKKLMSKLDSSMHVKLKGELAQEINQRMVVDKDIKDNKARQDVIIKGIQSAIERNKRSVEELNSQKLTITAFNKYATDQSNFNNNKTKTLNNRISGNEEGVTRLSGIVKNNQAKIESNRIELGKNTVNDNEVAQNLGPRISKVEARLDSMLQGTTRLMAQLSKLKTLN